MPRGGKRIGAGRKEGVPNKVTRTLKEYAGQYSEEAINGLLGIAREAETPPQARVAAWREILDRAVGKAPQAITDADGNNLQVPGSVLFVVSQQKASDNRT